jgi:hypothetical protein
MGHRHNGSNSVADSGYKSISRIDVDEKKMHGWYVRVYFKNKMHAKFFSDSRFGGKDESLKEAVIYRNALEEKLGKPRSERTVVSLSPRNRSGAVGVRRRRKSAKRGNPDGYEVFEITWSPAPGVMRRTSVSIDRYGEEEAFRRAVEIRKEKEREIYGQENEVDLPDDMSQG